MCRHAAECYEKLSESPPEWSDGTPLVFFCEESLAALSQRYLLRWSALFSPCCCQVHSLLRLSQRESQSFTMQQDLTLHAG